jgi:putative ABC transport system permease protein
MLRFAPWRRAPLLLLRRPGVALALASAAFVAALPAAAAPMFLSAARNATLHHQIAQGCPWQVAGHVSGHLAYDPSTGVTPPPDDRAFVAYRERKARELAPAALAGPRTTLWWTGDSHAGTTDTGLINVLARHDFAQHVEVRAGGTGPGLWIPHTLAGSFNLRVGDQLVLDGRTFRGFQQDDEVRVEDVSLPIAAIYTDLRARPADPYWCTVRRLYEGEPGQEFSNRPIAPLVLTDPDTALATAGKQQFSPVHELDFDLRDPRLTYPQAQELVGDLARMEAGLRADPLTAVDFQITARIRDFVPRAALVRASLPPSVLPITAAGVLVGLLVVGAAAVFWVQRRRRELTVLAAHGVGPAALGVKAFLEAVPALTVGAAAGAAAAYTLVRQVGPSDVLSPDAVPRSLLAATAALVAATVVVAVAAAVRCRSLTDVVRRHRRVRLLGLPWELVLVAAGVVLWLTLDASRELTSDANGSVARVPAKLLVVPILMIIAAAALGSRLGTRWLRRPRPAAAPGAGAGRAAFFLAGRRLRREAAVATLLAAATAVPVAFAGYGATVTGSVRATLAAEARFIIGADVVLTLSERVPVPASLAGRATEVGRLNSAIIGGVQADVLFVDPGTYARDAFWDARPAGGRDLDEVMTTLRRGGVVGADPVPGGLQEIRRSGVNGNLDVTAVPLIPGEQGGYPVVLAASDAAPELAALATPQLFVRGDPAEVRRAAVDARLPLLRVQVADDLYANTIFEPLTYTFEYLAALSLLTGLITTVGLLLYLESRTPMHRRAYALLRRMRLRPGTHLGALTLELAAPLVAGLAGGAALAALIAMPLFPDFEINPALPPATVLAVPLGAVAGICAAVAVIALLAVTYAQRRVGRATPAEVLRDVAG